MRTARVIRAAAAAALLLAGAPLAALPAAAQQVLAAHTLRPGTVLGPEHLLVPPGAEARAAALHGLEVRRAIFAQRPVQPGDLGPETLVRRNAVVTMLYSAGGLAIRTEGRALDAGGEGERVRVMNLSSRQAVPAVVRARDLVEVIR